MSPADVAQSRALLREANRTNRTDFFITAIEMAEDMSIRKEVRSHARAIRRLVREHVGELEFAAVVERFPVAFTSIKMREVGCDQFLFNQKL